MRILFAVLVIIVLFAFTLSGFRKFDKNNPDPTKTYRVVETDPVNGRQTLNIVELPLDEYHTPTPIPTEPPPIIELPSPTFGPSPTPLPTNPPTPIPTFGPSPTPQPTSPPPPPPSPIPLYNPSFIDTIIQFFLE